MVKQCLTVTACRILTLALQQGIEMSSKLRWNVSVIICVDAPGGTIDDAKVILDTSGKWKRTMPWHARLRGPDRGAALDTSISIRFIYMEGRDVRRSSVAAARRAHAHHAAAYLSVSLLQLHCGRAARATARSERIATAETAYRARAGRRPGRRASATGRSSDTPHMRNGYSATAHGA